MTKEEKRIKELFDKYTPEELAESFVFPVKRTKKQKEQDSKDLAEARQKHIASRTPEETELINKITQELRLKFIEEDKNKD